MDIKKYAYDIKEEDLVAKKNGEDKNKEITEKKAPIEQIAITKPAGRSKRILLIFAVFISLFLFLTGFLLRGFLSPVKQAAPITTPEPLPTNTPVLIQTPSEDSDKIIQYLPGKQFYEDSIIVVTKQIPHITLIVSAGRIEQEAQYQQYTKIQYYNRENSFRETLINSTANASITNNTIIRLWEPSQNSIFSKNNDAKISLKYKETALDIKINGFKSDISVRSLPGFTKFVSQGEGVLTINGEIFSANIAYTRSYSSNASYIKYLNTPEKLTGRWFVFWDTKGNFYYIDILATENKQNIYENYSKGIREDSAGNLTELLDVNFNTLKDATDFGPYEFIINKPLKQQIKFSFINSFNKSASQAYRWLLGIGEGVITNQEVKDKSSLQGFGVLELIEPK